MGCFLNYQGKHRAKPKLSSAATTPLRAHHSLKLLKDLKIGPLSSHFAGSCNNNVRKTGFTHSWNVSRNLITPYTRARAAFRSASSKFFRQRPKALRSTFLGECQKVRTVAERRGLAGRYGSDREESAVSDYVSLALGNQDDKCTSTHLFPLPLPPSDVCATSTSEDLSLQSISSSSSASSSSSCSSAPFSTGAGLTHSQRHESHASVSSPGETKEQYSMARPLPPPPPSESSVSLREYSYDALAGACLNFANEFYIRDGGAGPVFKALLRKNPDESCAEVEVTKLSRGHQYSFKKWRSEVGILGRLSHPNICKVLGFSQDDLSASGENLISSQRERLLVYEHTSKGSLENLLYGRKARVPPLDWETRVKIAVGAAQGLAFLHERTPRQIVYKIFKPLNIQVDCDFNTKLSDYGFARTPTKLLLESPTPFLPLDWAYAAPETRIYNELTPKSNVWSFGIVLLELLTGRQNMDDFFAADERNLLQWCRPLLLDPKRLYLMMDPEMKGRYSTITAKTVADLALRCLSDDGGTRPSMADVVALLSPLVGTSLFSSTRPSRALFSYDLHSSDHRHVENGSALGNGSKLSYSKSCSLASILASPARSFAANPNSNEFYRSPARDSKIRFKGFLSGEIMKEYSHLLVGWREHPFISQSSHLRGDFLSRVDEFE